MLPSRHKRAGVLPRASPTETDTKMRHSQSHISFSTADDVSVAAPGTELSRIAVASISCARLIGRFSLLPSHNTKWFGIIYLHLSEDMLRHHNSSALESKSLWELLPVKSTSHPWNGEIV